MTKNSIQDKKAFTLIEVIIVIIITLLLYTLLWSNKDLEIKQEKVQISLLNLKNYLIKNFNFEKEIVFSCIEGSFNCYLKIDNKLQEDFLVEHFFVSKPNIYEYNKYKKELIFDDLKVNNFTYKVVFELKINQDYKMDEFIIDTLDGKVYLFNSIYQEPIIFKDFEEIVNNIEENKREVKNAF